MPLTYSASAHSKSINSAIAYSSELYQIEDWLGVLTNTYAKHPSDGLAKVIAYYLTRIIKHADFMAFANQPCHYYTMLKFWREQIQ
ncbi:MAG: hypothetical protein QMC62_10830 [Alteromonadaceae bacterium]|jgi:hypothetical protein